MSDIVLVKFRAMFDAAIRTELETNGGVPHEVLARHDTDHGAIDVVYGLNSFPDRRLEDGCVFLIVEFVATRKQVRGTLDKDGCDDETTTGAIASKLLELVDDKVDWGFGT